MNQVSIFDFIDETEYITNEERIFRSVIEKGSNIEGSLSRIKKNIGLPMVDFVAFLKKEFGIGGSCYTGYATLWDARGIKVGTSLTNMKLYSWEIVANSFKRKYGEG